MPSFSVRLLPVIGCALIRRVRLARAACSFCDYKTASSCPPLGIGIAQVSSLRIGRFNSEPSWATRPDQNGEKIAPMHHDVGIAVPSDKGGSQIHRLQPLRSDDVEQIQCLRKNGSALYS